MNFYEYNSILERIRLIDKNLMNATYFDVEEQINKHAPHETLVSITYALEDSRTNLTDKATLQLLLGFLLNNEEERQRLCNLSASTGNLNAMYCYTNDFLTLAKKGHIPAAISFWLHGGDEDIALKLLQTAAEKQESNSNYYIKEIVEIYEEMKDTEEALRWAKKIKDNKLQMDLLNSIMKNATLWDAV